MHLGHPHLISLLCERAGVALPAGLPVSCSGGIDVAYIRKHCTKGPEAPVDQHAPTPAPVAPPLTNGQRLDQLEPHMRQMRVTLEEVKGTELHMCKNQQANRRLMEMMVGMIRGLGEHMQSGPEGQPIFPTDQEIEAQAGWHPFPEDDAADEDDSQTSFPLIFIILTFFVGFCTLLVWIFLVAL